ncbi:hypothetical protein CFOL_v3_29487, partial [Cephalotus follicularis]
DASD